MRTILWRFGFTLTVLGLVFMLGPAAGCGWTSRIVERVLRQTPQAEIRRYLTAIAAADREQALARWPLIAQDRYALVARRQLVTNDLMLYGPTLTHAVERSVWWRTCCEPAVVQNSTEAGAARFWVSLCSRDRAEAVFVFDLRVPGGYWGAAAGYPVRHWAIADVYPVDEKPLAHPYKE